VCLVTCIAQLHRDGSDRLAARVPDEPNRSVERSIANRIDTSHDSCLRYER